MPPRDDAARIADILIAASRIKRFTDGMSHNEFAHDEKTRYAVLACFEVIGEAAAAISDETKAALKKVPWVQIRAMRNRLAHEYFAVNWDLIWEVIVRDLDPLVRELRRFESGTDDLT